MLRLGICDDDICQLRLVYKYLKSYCTERNIQFQTIAAQDTVQFLTKIQIDSLDIALLDIEIGQGNGIDLATEINKRNKDTVIVFITGFIGYAYKAFQVRAFNYITKPITKEQFYITMDEVLEEVGVRKYLNENKYQKFHIYTKTLNRDILYDDILYFEKEDKKVNVHCCDELITYRTTFNNIEETLDPDVFYRCHQGYIININKVNYYQDGVVYIGNNKTPIPVSKKNIKRIRQAIGNKLLG